MKIRLLQWVVGALLATTVWAADGFVVRQIRVEGLEGIRRETVLNYLPVRVGQTWSSRQSIEAIRTLYATGFFEDVQLSRGSGDVLVVHVVERNIIGAIHVFGNETLPKDRFDTALKEMGLVQGRPFKQSVLEEIKKTLEVEYRRLGKERVIVRTIVKSQPRHRVDVTIDINEGDTDQIGEIVFVGNHAFSSGTLSRQLKISDWGLFTWITKKDRYSKEKLDESLESLRTYYLNHGYLKFKVLDTQVTPMTGKKKLSVMIKISEGVPYRIKGFELKGRTILPASELRQKITLTSGDVYDQEKVQKSIEAMGTMLGDRGYGYANIDTSPIFDEAHRQVTLVFNFEPGPQLYVRNIHFKGNYKTSDVVMRYALRQNESALLSVSKVKESERQLRLLNYFDQVEVKTQPVEGTNNQVDLDFNVNETPSAEAMAAVGYGTDGFLVSAGINQNNFLGTGRTVGANFKKTSVTEAYHVNYFNPYVTPEGLGRGFDVFYEKTTPRRVDIAHFTTEQYGLTVNHSYPLSDVYKVLFGVGATRMKILNLGRHPSAQIFDFVRANGDDFKQGKAYVSWVQNTYDQLPFPTQGLRQELGVTLFFPLDADSLTYYKASYDFKYYFPLGNDFILNPRFGFGYGHSLGKHEDFPFFENYYAGGIADPGMVRGYETYSLGPRDSNDDPLGGNFLGHGTLGLIFPNFISHDKLRTQIFLDAGNVYDKDGTRFRGTGSGPLRYSVGLGADWQSPLGPLSFSIAKPLNAQDGDRKRFFDFTISVPI